MIYGKILQLCKQNDMNISQLERICGLGNGAISRWTRTPKTVKSLKKVADYFGVTVDYLLK